MENIRRTYLEETIAYYDNNAVAFIDSTFNADVSELYKLFEEAISSGTRILDLGCGSGRDSKYFTEHGFNLVAIDPSLAMCEQTRSLVKIPVFQMKAEEMRFTDEFDAVWACASLLHISRDKQMDTLYLISNLLKSGGVCYASWKYGSGDRFDGGRQFTDFTEESFRDLLKKVSPLKEMKVWTTEDVRGDRQNQKWLNVLMKK